MHRARKTKPAAQKGSRFRRFEKGQLRAAKRAPYKQNKYVYQSIPSSRAQVLQTFLTLKVDNILCVAAEYAGRLIFSEHDGVALDVEFRVRP